MDYIHESEGGLVNKGLDFYVPVMGCFIEVKRFHTDRIARQLRDREDVILLVGERAVSVFCIMLARLK